MNDSINYRWNGSELSPAEKYDIAFNGWTPAPNFASLRPFTRNNPVPGAGWDPDYYSQLGPLATWVSNNLGNGDDRHLAERGRTDWTVEAWWGLCHAWVPAAQREPRPLGPVTVGGVTFEVGDLEALLIAAHNRTEATLIGG